MMHNKATETHEVEPFKSIPRNPQVLQKRIQKHVPQRLTVRLSDSDFNTDGTHYILDFKIPTKSLENLPDVCYVACSNFNLREQGITINKYIESCYNIESPLFTNENQILTSTAKSSILQTQYSPIIATIPANNSTVLLTVASGAITDYSVSFQQQILDNGVGCFVVDRNILNNSFIPFTITGTTGAIVTSNPYGGIGYSYSLQFTLVFYGYNDDERYSAIPQGAYF